MVREHPRPAVSCVALFNLLLGWQAAFGFESIQAPVPSMAPPPTGPISIPSVEKFTPSTVGVDSVFSNTGGFGTIDLSNRQLAVAFYRLVFNAAEGIDMSWTGDYATCTPGDTSDSFKDAVLIRVNWYRAMAGVPDDVIFLTGAGSYSAKAQEAALLMSSNNGLSHFPPISWNCYTAAAAEAASSSNLSLGNAGWDAITGQMRDNGANNSAAGHRRWILYPQTQNMGTGDVPGNATQYSANSLWVVDSHYGDARPDTRDDFVAWPPPGYVPYQVVYPRWSFSYPDADFSSASVSMSSGGSSVAVSLEPVQSYIGENTLVWVAGGLSTDADRHWPMPAIDTTYDVSVQNVNIGGSPQTFNYQVTVMDPAVSQALPLSLSGSQNLDLGGTTFTYDTLDFSDTYQLRESAFVPYAGPEGAEDGGANIVDHTNSDYDLLSTLDSALGSYAFHLAHTTPTDQYFEIDREFVLGDSSVLQFYSRLGYATTDQVGHVQMSLDDGASWIDLYTQAGNNSSGDADFTQRFVDLSGYAQRTARFRVLYAFSTGSYYYQASSVVGFYVDDVDVLDVSELGATRLFTLDQSGSYEYTPAAEGDYGLQVKAVPWHGFSGLEWGTTHDITVTAAEGGCNGDSIVISTSFSSGQTVTCSATSSINTLGDVSVPSTANVRFVAPMISLGSGFAVQSGGRFSIGN